jgi:hypothetical protein
MEWLTWKKQDKEKIMKDKKCMIGNEIYEPDFELCDDELCFVCRGGVWQQKRLLS